MPKIYLYRAPVDFKKQANGLALLVEQELDHDTFSGALYALTNRQRNKIKCVIWEDNSFVMYYWSGPTKVDTYLSSIKLLRIWVGG
ncbi:IS66 family insertion sequence element accessory protein TnpB [Oceanisphaera pacifica]|uniref:IS66 family insertion sequence element accessory protein TnpB n=1 Tax=Oceanisphaera pacifica TaxID=2818389 RepID=A0ABS3NJL8_9GAMM|nr:IS66 family insertion sequence element accessory protein TnpB [Oceanisphaera pacifica]MBO1520763.1 IS66 family insertion sequence element accessory protein TnpB [Oceanisphaera pacifica]